MQFVHPRSRPYLRTLLWSTPFKQQGSEKQQFQQKCTEKSRPCKFKQKGTEKAHPPTENVILSKRVGRKRAQSLYMRTLVNLNKRVRTNRTLP
jgi:hypothetical protein